MCVSEASVATAIAASGVGCARGTAFASTCLLLLKAKIFIGITDKTKSLLLGLMDGMLEEPVINHQPAYCAANATRG